MNRAERRAEERAFRRGVAVIHEELLPGGCPKCRGAERLWWFGLGDAFDLFGSDVVSLLLEPLGDAPADEERVVDIWLCECGGSGAFSW